MCNWRGFGSRLLPELPLDAAGASQPSFGPRAAGRTSWKRRNGTAARDAARRRAATMRAQDSAANEAARTDWKWIDEADHVGAQR